MTAAKEFREQLHHRSNELRAWLARNGVDCHMEQLHTKSGTSERIYWHYGYLMAVEDVLRLLDASKSMSSDSHKSDNEP